MYENIKILYNYLGIFFCLYFYVLGYNICFFFIKCDYMGDEIDYRLMCIEI